jgi:chromate reductase
MITIISGTNRGQSNTRKVSDIVADLYRRNGDEQQVFDLIDLPREVAFSEVFGNRSNGFSEQVERYVANVDKFVFVIPEYNGGFPGVLKLMLDAVEPHHWYGKKAALIGLSTGRSGNLRGVEHLMGVLNYLQVNVLHFKPALARLPAPTVEAFEMPKEYVQLLELQVELFRNF